MSECRALVPVQPVALSARLLTMDGKRATVAVVEGASVREIVEACVPRELRPFVVAFCNGCEVADWSLRARVGDSLLLTVQPGGNKGLLAAVLMVAVMIFAAYAAPALVGVLGEAGIAITESMAFSAITMVGSMIVTALVKPPAINTGGGPTAGAQSYSLAGQSNAAAPYGPCMVIYGRHKVMPRIAANPNVDNLGERSVLTSLYDFGLGWVELEDLRIGDVTIDQYDPTLVLHQDSTCRPLQLNGDQIGYDQYTYELQQNDALVLRTKPETSVAYLDMQMARGCYQQPADGGRPFRNTVDLRARWRPVGGPWTDAPISFYMGALDQYYWPGPTAADQIIQYFLPGGEGSSAGWTDYEPATSPADLAKRLADWKAAGSPQNDYPRANLNPNVAFQYFGGAITDAVYFGRYPEILRAGWTLSARDHFERIGSREGRNPGVETYYFIAYTDMEAPELYYHPQYTHLSPPIPVIASRLHYWDMVQWPGEPFRGGWGWIESGSALPSGIRTDDVPWQWRLKPGGVFAEATYLGRYQEARDWVNAQPGRTGWQYFTAVGAFKGHDPYVWSQPQSVRMEIGALSSHWIRISVPFLEPGEYEIEIMRTDVSQDGTDTSKKPGNIIRGVEQQTVTTQVNQVVVALLRSIKRGEPVRPALLHTMLEMQVVATQRLTGVVQNLSAIATSVLRTTTDGVTFTYRPTRNPAWIALDILTSERNTRRLSDGQIDWPSWVHLAAACDTVRTWVLNGLPFSAPRYTCDTVVTEFTTVRDLVESVLSTCRASLMLTTAGLWGVLHDEEKATPRQLITPANSWGFSGARAFNDMPHALRVNFVNRDRNWSRDEVIVYDDGYSVANATKFETLDTFGITDYPHAWAYGRFMMAQGIQRSEVFTLSMDAENLVVQRGDLVQVAHDVPKIGGIPSRIDAIGAANAGPNGGTVIHCALEVSAAVTGYSLRRNDGTIQTGRVWSTQPGGLFELDTTAGELDALIVLGEFERVTADYLVTTIRPGADLSAELTLCRYVPGVYQADQGALPEWDGALSSTDWINGTDLVSANLTATQRIYHEQRDPRVAVAFAWTTSGFALRDHTLTLILPNGERRALASGIRGLDWSWVVDPIADPHLIGLALQLEVMPLATNGNQGRVALVSFTLAGDTAKPGAVLSFGLNVQKEHVDLFWQPPADEDVSHYLLRYTPQLEYPDWNASQVLASIAWPTTRTTAGARTGSYGVRVVDTSGNVSDVVWRRTTVATLPEINVVETLDDAALVPPWPGRTSHADVVGPVVQSEGAFGSVYPLGYYYFAEVLDLGDVYEVRISSKLEAYGVIAADYMASWPTLDQVPALAQAGTDLWDVWLEVRGNNAIAVIADWPTLQGVDFLASGEEEAWTEWRPVAVGDFTAQLLQFRIVLQSQNPGVRAAVRGGLVEVDMPDRSDSYGDVAVPAGGLDFLFDPPFRELWAVAVTIDGSAVPLVAIVSNKTAEGFHLVLRNTITQALTAGQVDILAEGYGRLRPSTI